jgi:tricorn protease-like protein
MRGDSDGDIVQIFGATVNRGRRTHFNLRFNFSVTVNPDGKDCWLTETREVPTSRRP